MREINDSGLTSLSSILPIQGWHDFLEDGKGFLSTATGAFNSANAIFTRDILYNLVAMSIEKFVMAALMRYGTMPYNHTMVDLVEAMEETFPHAIDDIREGLLKLDTYQDICDPYEFTIITPAPEEIPEMLALANKLQQLVECELTINV